MWGQLCLLWTLLWAVWSAPSTICPTNCKCNSVEPNEIEARCSNLEFLAKLRPKQVAEIVSLDLSSGILKRLDHKLEKLKNVRRLDLSHNKIEDLTNFPQLTHLVQLSLKDNAIKQFTADGLPKSIQHLDLSSNFITNVPDVTRAFPNLKEINLNDNYLNCNCDLVKVRDKLFSSGVHIVRSPTCQFPPNVEGKSLLAVYCVNGNVMYDDDDFVGDEAFGSGEGDPLSKISAMQFDDDQNIDTDQIEPDYFQSNSSGDNLSSEEGSGVGEYEIVSESDYGSGEKEDTTDPIIIVPETNVRNCFYDCSTLPPIGDHEPTNTSIIQDMNKLLIDLSGGSEGSASHEPPVTEQIIIKETIPQVLAPIKEDPGKPPEQDDVIRKVQVGSVEPKEVEKQVKSSNQNTTFIIVGVLLVLMGGLVGYFIYKRKRTDSAPSNNRISNDLENEKHTPVEMKPLMTTPVQKNTNNIAEKAPLINGQNGTHKENDEDARGNNEPVEDHVDNDRVELRSRQDEDDGLLAAETKRVTIEAKELSSPKSPVFVRVHDGRIITTPTHDH